MGRILYHYTDYAALSGIVTNGELRVNNVLNMNDSTEMLFLLESAKDEISKVIGPELKRLLQEDSKEYDSYYKDPLYKHSAYAACFSLYEDDAAQWERYGNRGRGVCIGFDEELLKKILVPGISLENVYYDSDKKSKEIAADFLKIVEGHEEDIIEGNISAEMVAAYDSLIRRSWICSAAYKHPSFASENEVRMVFWPELSSLEGILPEYHITSERIKKYYPLNLEDLCNKAGVNFEDLFVTISVGPESTQSPEILADYFCNVGFSKLAERTKKSECPLRSALRG